MTTIFKLKKFLRYIDDEMLLKFFKSQDIPLELTEKGKKEKREDYWERIMNYLDSKSFAKAELAFQEVHNMAKESGVLSLIAFFKRKHPSIAVEIEPLGNNHNQALFLYMKDPEIFKKVAAIAYFGEKKVKAERKGLKQVSADQIKERVVYLASELKEYLVKNDGRGRNCHIDLFEDEDSVYFVAYPEDYVRSDLYYQDNQFVKATKRPSFEIVFIYYPNEGRIELLGKGGRKKQAAFFNIFNQTVLQDDKAILEFETIYNLDKVLHPDFEPVTKPEDQIEYVSIKQIQLTDRFNQSRSSKIAIDGKGIKPIQEEVKQRNLDLKSFRVTQVSFVLKFPGKGRQGSVTMELTHPDKCNLNESDTHKRAKAYISIWGLDYQDAD